MTRYERPEIQAPTFRDEAGLAIPYGARWGMDSPPDDSYSVESHLERFAPLHLVADALIAHLIATFDVEVTEGPDALAGLEVSGAGILRAVRLRPRDPACASLTIALTSYPGVLL